jgi:hypothetical protein
MQILHFYKQVKMIFDLHTLDLSILKVLYDGECKELERKLLHGALWEELEQQRKKVSEISMILHKKIQDHQEERSASLNNREMELP